MTENSDLGEPEVECLVCFVSRVVSPIVQRHHNKLLSLLWSERFACYAVNTCYLSVCLSV